MKNEINCLMALEKTIMDMIGEQAIAYEDAMRVIKLIKTRLIQIECECLKYDIEDLDASIEDAEFVIDKFNKGEERPFCTKEYVDELNERMFKDTIKKSTLELMLSEFQKG